MSNIIRLKHENTKRISVRIKDDFADFASEKEMKQDLFRQQLEEKFAEGFSTGYEKAKAELEREYSERIQKKFTEFTNVMKSVEDKVISYDSEFENLVIDVSFEIASKIARRELQKESGIETTLKESLRKILGANNVIVKLHPDDYSEIINGNSQNNFFDESFAKMKFESNERIEKGGCIVETEIGNVDGRVISRLNELKRYFEHENEGEAR
jgi:flagellar assembly protein FliH